MTDTLVNQQKKDIYPSRQGGIEEIIPRVDPVVYGEEQPGVEFSLDSSQLDSYHDNGFLVLNDYMSEFVASLNTETNTLKRDMNGRDELICEPGSDEVRTIFKPFAFSDLVDKVSRHPKILTIAKQILGSDVYLTQSRINIKPAFKGKSFPWHSDFETWHVEDGMPRMRALTAWIMLNDNTDYNGPLYLIPGSHHEYVSCAGKTLEGNYALSLKTQTLGVPCEYVMRQMLENRQIKGVYGKAGTVVFHECNIMHGSSDNISDKPRNLLMFVYNSCENKFVSPFCDQSPRPGYLRNTDFLPLQSN